MWVLGTNLRSSVTVARALTTEHSLNTQLLGLPSLVESDQCFLPRNQTQHPGIPFVRLLRGILKT